MEKIEALYLKVVVASLWVMPCLPLRHMLIG